LVSYLNKWYKGGIGPEINLERIAHHRAEMLEFDREMSGK